MDDDDPMLTEEFAACVGRLAMTWATLEVALDMCAFAIFHRFNGSTLEKELPRSLERKIRFIKDAFRKLPPLGPERDRAIRLLDSVAASSAFRHDVLHGVALGMFNKLKSEASDVPMTRLMREATGFKARRFVVSAESIIQEAVNVARLSKGAWVLAEALILNK